MSFQLLTFLCGVAKFFGITPASIRDKSDSALQKCYVVLMFSLLTVGVAVNTYFKEFYKHYVHIKVVVCFLNDACLYGLNFSTIIGQTFWKRQLWNSTIKHLKKSGLMTQVIEKSEGVLPHYFGFLLANAFHITATITIGYLSYSVKDTKYFEQEAAGVAQIYLAFLFKFVLCVITNMILSRYKGLRELISKHLKQQQMQNHSKFSIDELPMQFIQKIEYTMCFLKKTVDIYNEMFGWPLFFLISYTTLGILNNIDYAIFQSQHPTVLYIIFFNIGVTTWDFLLTVTLIVICDAVVQEAESIVTLTYEVRLLYSDSAIKQNYKMQEFTNFIVKNMPQFTATNFFDIGRSTILSMLGTISTFLIIMIQFGKQENV